MPYKNPEGRRARYKERYQNDPEFRAREQERHRGVTRRWQQANPEKAKAWQRANPEKVRESARNYARRTRESNPESYKIANRWAKHGLRPHDLYEIWEQQGGLCYLCQEPLDIEDACIDHDHRCCPERSSCKFCRRGLTHGWCNSGVGYSHEDPDRMRRWADNLEAAQHAVTARLDLRAEQLMLDLG